MTRVRVTPSYFMVLGLSDMIVMGKVVALAVVSNVTAEPLKSMSRKYPCCHRIVEPLQNSRWKWPVLSMIRESTLGQAWSNFTVRWSKV